jgi:hypothetical protein
VWVGFEAGDDVEFPFRAQNLESLKSGASGKPQQEIFCIFNTHISFLSLFLQQLQAATLL